MEWWHIGVIVWGVSSLTYGVGYAMGSYRSSRVYEAVWDRTTREDAQTWSGRNLD